MRAINFTRPLIGTAIILAIPALSMLFSVDGWMWGPMDFIIMGGLIYLAGLTYEFLARKARNTSQKIFIGFAVGFALFVIWSQLAVQAVSQLIEFLF